MRRDVGEMRMIEKITVLSVIAVVLIGCAPHRQEPTQAMPAPTALTKDDAIRLSREACAGKIEVPEDSQAIVTETNGIFVVTFPQPLQPEVLHGDIYARVTIDKATGSVVEMETGP